MVDGVKAMAEEPEPEHPREDVQGFEARVRRYVELYPHPSLAGEILYDDAFNSEEWPRRAYALDREDVVKVLRELDFLREQEIELGKILDDIRYEEVDQLRRENRGLRREIERYWKVVVQTTIESKQAAQDDQAQAEAEIRSLRKAMLAEKARQDDYEETVVGDMNEQATNDARKIAKLEKDLKASQDLVASMRLNGARHWFSYKSQRCTNTALGKWVDICGICEKERDHPAHFAADAKYLDSRGIEEAVAQAQERLCQLLEDGMKLGARTALNTARELLQGLPGVKEFQPFPGRPEVKD